MKQTAVEWLIEKMLDNGIGICREWREQAKEMERKQMDSNCSQLDKPTMIFGEHQIQMLEISDEEIAKQGFLYSYANELPDENAISFIQGVEWYREQLKQKTNG